MKNFYIFFIAFLISGLGFGQDSNSLVSAPITQISGGTISSLVDTPGEAVDVFAFTITDEDTPLDTYPTIVTTIRLKKAPSSTTSLNLSETIEGVTLDNGSSIDISSINIQPSFIEINIDSGDLVIADGTSQTITVGIYLKSSGTLTENSIISFLIDDAIPGISTPSLESSLINRPFLDIVGNSFTIDVTATQLTFLTQPSNVAVGAEMNPVVEVGFTDLNGNVDINPNLSPFPNPPVLPGAYITISSGGTFSSATQTRLAAVDGVATFENIFFADEATTGISLTAVNSLDPGTTITGAVSNIFNVGALPTQTTYTFDNGWTLPNGDPNGVSLSTDKIVIASGNASISEDTSIYDVTVAPGASLTVQVGARLIVVDNLTLDSQSNSYSSFIFNGTPNAVGTVVGGPMFYNRFVNSQANGNDLISPPFDNQSLTTFFNANASLLFNNGLTDPTTYLFGPFNKSTGTYTNWDSNETGNLAIATGYRAATISGATLQFTGNLRRDQVPVTLNYGGAIYKDWNLVGNPFPSYIDIFDFLSFVVDSGTDPDTRNIDLLTTGSGIYGYNALENNSYTVVTLANAGDSPQETFIAPGQGFLVPAKDNIVSFGGGQLIFDPSMRTTGSSDDFISNRNANTEFIFLKLKAYTATKTYGTQFYFNENASLEIDHGYDGRILGNPPSFALYSNAIPDESQLPLALQALNPSDLANTTIPLGVKSNAGQQITFSISESTLPNTVEVYLEDTLTNTFTLLNDGDYTITPNVNLNGTGRFYLRLGDTALSTKDTTLDDLQIYTDYNARTIVISGNLTEITNVSVFDIEGRLVSKTKLTASSQTQSINMDSFSAGVYVIQLDNSTQTKTQKVIWR